MYDNKRTTISLLLILSLESLIWIVRSNTWHGAGEGKESIKKRQVDTVCLMEVWLSKVYCRCEHDRRTTWKGIYVDITRRKKKIGYRYIGYVRCMVVGNRMVKSWIWNPSYVHIVLDVTFPLIELVLLPSPGSPDVETFGAISTNVQCVHTPLFSSSHTTTWSHFCSISE